MEKKRIHASPDFKGLRHSKIGYFKEVRSKIKELEELNIQLARRHNRLDAIFNSMNDGVTILDRNLNVVFTNRVLAKFFPEISDTPIKCHQLFYKRATQCPHCPVRKTLETGEILDGEHVYKKGNLAGRHFEWTTSPIVDANDNVDEIILILRDITERKKYELQLMQIDRMVSVGFLATSLAHEINNPLTSIAGFSEGLLKRLKNNEIFKDPKLLAFFNDYLEIINNEAYRCRDIIQNLREFSNSASDGYEIVNIHTIITDTIALIRQYAKDHQIKILFQNNLTTGFDKMRGKSGQLKHLFLNLFKQLFNALESGGVVKVGAHNDGDKIEITMADPNCSISKDFTGCLTYPSPDSSIVNGQEKMDLMICFNIIRQHRGELRFLKGKDDVHQLSLRFPAVLT